VNEGVISKKLKFLMHAAITASLHDVDATAMHLTGAIRAGATKKEILETVFTIIPVAGMPAFAIFLNASKKARAGLDSPSIAVKRVKQEANHHKKMGNLTRG
jgi:alkylhydroperoxidase/carboxymuconolactone decarboxylase family protein YurZ